MSYLEFNERIQTLHNLIKLRSSGSTKDLSKKLNCSERTVHRLISIVRHIRGDVYWSRDYWSYCYS